MSAAMVKPWIPVSAEALEALPATTGVFEIKNLDEVVDIQYAGSNELFGLQSAIAEAIGGEDWESLWFRYEVHVQYQSRYVELILNHRAHHGGEVPARVAHRDIPVVGRITPDTLPQKREAE